MMRETNYSPTYTLSSSKISSMMRGVEENFKKEKKCSNKLRYTTQRDNILLHYLQNKRWSLSALLGVINK
jgi:hypothetical protein